MSNGPQPVSKALSRDDGNPNHKSLLRQILFSWEPATSDDAKQVAEECLFRAEALVNIVGDPIAREHSELNFSDLREALGTVADLVYLSYRMIEWWDEACPTPAHHGRGEASDA